MGKAVSAELSQTLRCRLLTVLGLLLCLTLGSLGLPPGALAEKYQEFFDQQLFHERVNLLNRVSPGATQKEVLGILGPPQSRERDPEGNAVFIYRVRCYAGPEPGSRWPRHLSLTYEMRLLFDGEGRVRAVRTNP